MKRLIPIMLATLLFVIPIVTPVAADEEPNDRIPPSRSGPLIEVAVLLDTSGSMSGLINQAQTRLWNIVNQMAIARKNGQTPNLQVALYQYGSGRLSGSSGWIRRVTPLTGDLDRVSEKLFDLESGGSNEYCGMVIQRSLDELKWTKGNHYKSIFIAGNEPFTQGSVDYRDAVRNAVERGIVVNTIHCGDEKDGREGRWAHAASLGDGRFLNINQNEASTSVDAPQDDRIRELNDRLNDTYVPYGEHGKKRKRLQEEQDRKAEDQSPESATQRSLAKWKDQYKNSSWDLIDALEEKEVKLSELESDRLPEELRDKSLEEQEAYLEKKRRERNRIREQLKELENERREYVRNVRQKRQGEDTFGSAVRKVLAEQLEKKGYSTTE